MSSPQLNYRETFERLHEYLPGAGVPLDFTYARQGHV